MKKICLILGMLLLTINAYGAAVVSNVDYVVVPNPVPLTTPQNKIDIKEFFSFTCIHCRDVESLIEAKIAENKSLYLEQIQVPWDTKTTTLAKLNATYQIMGLKTLYAPTFAAIFAGVDLTDEKLLIAFLRQNNVDVKTFMANYNSFAVSAAPGRYKNLMDTYNVSGTPTFIVANKYILKPATPTRTMEVLEYLIKQQKVQQ